MIKDRLSDRMGKDDIVEMANRATADEKVLAEIYKLMFDNDKRTSDNAAWVLSHMPKSGHQWLTPKKDEMIDEALRTSSITKRRIIMALLDKQEFAADEVRTDFLDFCFASLTDPEETFGIRALAAKLAYTQCRHYPELCGELRQTLELIGREPLKPGLRHTRMKIMKLL